MTAPPLPPALLALSPGDLCTGASSAGRVPDGALAAFVRAARDAIAAGLRGILLREPGLADGEFLRLAQSLAGELAGAATSTSTGGWLGVHDRAHLVRPAGAHGLHVGFRSLPPRLAREVVGPDVAIGFSSHAGDAPERWSGADYLFHGPVHETASKAGRLPPVGYAGLAELVRCGPPVWGLGGLRPEHAQDVIATGARGIAVLGGIFGDRAPGPAAARYLAALEGVRP